MYKGMSASRKMHVVCKWKREVKGMANTCWRRRKEEFVTICLNHLLPLDIGISTKPCPYWHDPLNRSDFWEAQCLILNDLAHVCSRTVEQLVETLQHLFLSNQPKWQRGGKQVRCSLHCGCCNQCDIGVFMTRRWKKKLVIEKKR